MMGSLLFSTEQIIRRFEGKECSKTAEKHMNELVLGKLSPGGIRAIGWLEIQNLAGQAPEAPSPLNPVI